LIEELKRKRKEGFDRRRQTWPKRTMIDQAVKEYDDQNSEDSGEEDEESEDSEEFDE
jgi:hypothetical protein